jgi:hypothetical protein
MSLDEVMLREARSARDRVLVLQRDTEQAQVSYQHAIRRLNAAGGSLREIADALGLSYQRVHQIVDASAGKGAVKASKLGGTCSFCGAPAEEAQKLIGGPRVLICDRCVDLAGEVVSEGGERANERALLTAVDLDAAKVRCSFCGKRRDQADAMARASRQPGLGKFGRRDLDVRICNDCLALCDKILAEAASGPPSA